jgi:hypothetical protein
MNLIKGSSNDRLKTIHLLQKFGVEKKVKRKRKLTDKTEVT